MKTLLISTLTILSVTSLSMPTQAQTLPISEVLNTVGHMLNAQCNDLIAAQVTEATTEYRGEVHQVNGLSQQDSLTHNTVTHNQQNPLAVGQDCTSVANAYTQVLSEYFQYLNNSQTAENELFRIQAEQAQQQFSQDQVQQQTITQETLARFDTLLSPFRSPQDEPIETTEPEAIWPQPFFQLHK